ncbi:phosphotransferase [Actinopolymorpha sp. B17G11]|uniref:phosphotransferase n=1 Tax=Actinopolymorpha sp. B17G11 TaxID=3160861 RepID=UPI0032E49A29
MSATKPPELAMLWEASDPHDALRQRFGFTDAEEACQWLGVVLAKHWGFQVNSCERLVISAGNALAWLTTDAHRLVAKWSVVASLFPRLAELARLTDWLARRGLPVSGPVPALDGSHQVKIDGVSLGLQEVVDGAHLDVTDQDQVYAAGGVLADLHLALAHYPDVTPVVAVSARRERQPLRVLMSRTIESCGRAVPATDALRDWLDTAPPDHDLPVHLVHNDIRSANILCAGSTIRAVLDFEEVTLDHPVVDLAHGAVMLGTRFRNWGPVSPETHQAFIAGYQSRRRLSETEEAWLGALVLSGTLGFVRPGMEDPAGWTTSAHLAAEALR